MVSEVARVAFEAKTDDLVRADKLMGKLTQTGARLDSQVSKLSRQFTVQKGAATQLSYQLQDVAVQLGSGARAATVFTQQAPQILSVFGPAGAILGTVAAIGGAVAGPLVQSMFQATDASEDLEKAMKALDDTIKLTKGGTALLSEEFEILASKSREVAEVQLKARLIEATNASTAAFTLLKDEVEDLGISLEGTGRNAQAQSNRLRRTADDYGITTKQARELNEAIRGLSGPEDLDGIKQLQSAINEIALSGENGNDKFTKLAQAVNESAFSMSQAKEISDLLNDGLNDLDGTIKKSSESALANAEAIDKMQERQARAAERARELAAAQAERDRAQAASSLERLEFDLATREEKIRIAAERRQEMVARNLELENISEQRAAEISKQIELDKQSELYRLRDQRFKDAMQQQAQQDAETQAHLESSFDSITGLLSSKSRKFFEIMKAGSIATAVVKGVEAAVSSYAFGARVGGPYTGAAFAAISAAATGAQIGAIAAQKPPSARANGGQVMGGNSYLVGERGPEVLTMPSSGSVTPNHKLGTIGGAPKIDLQTNVQIIGGSQGAQVENTTRQVSETKYIQDVVVKLIDNPSSPAGRALQSRYALTPRGSR